MKDPIHSFCNTAVQCSTWCHRLHPAAVYRLIVIIGTAGSFSCKGKWERYPPIKLQNIAPLRTLKGSELSFEQRPSMVMVHIEINLCSRSIASMLKQPCQESFAYIELHCGNWWVTAPLLWKHRLHITPLYPNAHTDTERQRLVLIDHLIDLQGFHVQHPKPCS